MDEELQKAIALLESNGYVVTKPMMNEMTEHRGFESGKMYLIRQGRHKYKGLCTKSANGKFSFVVGKNLLDSDKPINVNGVLMKMVSCNDEVAFNKIKELQTLTNKIEPISVYQKFIFKEIE